VGQCLQSGIAAKVSVERAWQLLRTTNPTIPEEVTLDYHGLLGPGLTITSEVKRRRAAIGVRFEVIDHRTISYSEQFILNMTTQERVHIIYIERDPRILSFEWYQE
jgi:hypothetical protein